MAKGAQNEEKMQGSIYSEGILCGEKFSREFNFADCRSFAFRENKLSRIWIVDFRFQNKFSQISGKSQSPVRYWRYGTCLSDFT